MAHVLISGATGFLGRTLTKTLLSRGHRVRALVRGAASDTRLHLLQTRVPPGCEAVAGDPLDPAAYGAAFTGIETLVQLVGVSHPNPSKAAQFRIVDLAAAKAAIEAARNSGVRHFVYVSVAQPAPVMQEYIAVRSQVEAAIREAELNATILRPWYVVGPGRRWPLLLAPVYWVLSALPPTRGSARRLGLLSLDEMVQTMALAVEQPPAGIRILEVPQIRSIGRVTPGSRRNQ